MTCRGFILAWPQRDKSASVAVIRAPAAGAATLLRVAGSAFAMCCDSSVVKIRIGRGSMLRMNQAP